MVGFYESSESKSPFCGGSIIRSNIVLTAAHCSKLMLPDKFDKIQVTFSFEQTLHTTFKEISKGILSKI